MCFHPSLASSPLFPYSKPSSPTSRIRNGIVDVRQPCVTSTCQCLMFPDAISLHRDVSNAATPAANKNSSHLYPFLLQIQNHSLKLEKGLQIVHISTKDLCFLQKRCFRKHRTRAYPNTNTGRKGATSHLRSRLPSPSRMARLLGYPKRKNAVMDDLIACTLAGSS